jgi:hypothetical protein
MDYSCNVGFGVMTTAYFPLCGVGYQVL